MLFAQTNIQKTFLLYLPVRPDSNNLTGSVYGPGNNLVGSASLSLSSVNTTLSASGSLGARSLTLSSSSGVTAMDVYALGTGESVRVGSIAGNTVTLLRPLLGAAPSGSLFQSTKVTATLPAIGLPARHYRLEIAYSSGSVTQDVFYQFFDVTNYTLITNLNQATLLDREPSLGERMPKGIIFESLKQDSWDFILSRVTQRVNPGSLAGAFDLTRLHTIAFKMMLEELGLDGITSERYAMLSKLFEVEFEAMIPTVAVDQNQDKIISRNEQAFTTIRLFRSS